MKIQLIRSATIKLGFKNATLLIDPCLAPKFAMNSYAGNSKNPTVDLPLPVEKVLEGVDAVIVSHIHSDQFEPTAQKALKKEIPLFCQPRDADRIRGFGFTDVKPVQESAAFKGIAFQRFDGEHGSGTVLDEMGPVSGFFFQAPDAPSIFWLGDTVLTPALEELVTDTCPDVVVAHSGGAVWGKDRVRIVMDEAETVRLCELLPKSVVIATHMEALDHCVVTRAKLRECGNAKGIPASRLLIPADGETIDL